MSTAQQPLGLAIKLPFATADEFITKYGANLSRGGMYLRTKQLKPPGTPVTLDLKLQTGERVIYASAVVVYVTGFKAGEGVPGMGLRFTTVDEATKGFLEAVVKAHPHASSDEPPVPAGVGKPDYSPAAVAPSLAPPPLVSHPAPPPPPAAARLVVEGANSSGQVSAPPFEVPKEPPKRSGPIIGIDLGTTNSCAAFVRNGKPAVLASREGYNTVPSIIALNARGKLVVGHPAKGQMLTNPKMTVYGSKRLVGRPFNSSTVQDIKDRFFYEIVEDPETGTAAVKLGDRSYSLQQVSAMVLKEVKEVAQIQLGEPISRAVITVPAYYNELQRQAVRQAGRLAGMYVERIVNEPTAAAIAFGFGRKLSQRILIYDLGGGTFDASVLELHDTVYEVLSTGGDTFLGGLDFDNAIVSHLLAEFEKKTGTKFDGDRVAMQRITDSAERAKCQLSERAEVRVHVPFVMMIDGKPLDLDVNLTRDKLIALTEGLVERTLDVCRDVLAAKNLKPSDIAEIVMVGGQSRFPLVHDRIEAFFKKAPSRNVHPDEAVALGAALLAYSLSQDKEGVVLIDVLPMGIGVGIAGGRIKTVVDKNTPLPVQKTYNLITTRDGQKELEITVYQGESQNVADSERLGTVKLSGLTPAPRGATKVTVTFELNAECILKVSARDDKSGHEVTAVMSTKDTPEAAKKRLEETEASYPPLTTAEVPAVKTGGLMAWFKRLWKRG